MAKVRTRFAPSPTGFLHIGNLRSALYAYALAKHEKGDFILRIEDTDQKRQVEGATESLQNTLQKFGLIWDEYYVQSDRQKEGIYHKAAEKLISEGHAFYCQCQPKNVKETGFSKELRDPCREKSLTSGAVKLKVPENTTVSYYDFVHGKEISWNTDIVYDATLLKSDGFPTYHLAVAVDDLDMKVSHILRGHDWLPSTPIHLLVFEYLGGKRPEIGHLTDILSSETGKKLSKRRDAVFVDQFLEEGYLPEALLNFIMLLGWAPKDNRELYTLQEFVEHFNINGFQESNPKFFREKLDWINGHYIRQMSDHELINKIFVFYSEEYPQDILERIVPLAKERMRTLTDFKSLAGFIFTEPLVDDSLFGENFKEHISNALETLEHVPEWNLSNINDALMAMIEEKEFHTGKFFMDLRIAISGKKVTPPINESIEILGKEETLQRLQNVLQ